MTYSAGAGVDNIDINSATKHNVVVLKYVLNKFTFQNDYRKLKTFFLSFSFKIAHLVEIRFQHAN